MALVSFRWRRILRTSISTIIGCGCIGAVGSMGLSALLNWDPSGIPANPGGTGTWDYTSTLWDDNGTLPNVAWSDARGLDTAVFGGTGNLVHLGAPITASALTFNSTGYTIDNNGSALNTLTLLNSASNSPAVITSGAANVTSTISASVLGNDGLAFTSAAFTGTKTTLSGDNKFIGGVTIDSGTVELGHAGALNQSIRNTLTFGPSATIASALRLNSNSVTVRDLTGASSVSNLTNGGATDAILTVYQMNDKVVKTVLADGAAGKLELVKAGLATLTLGSDSTYTGATTVRGGILELTGNNVGRLTGTSAINLTSGGTLRLTNDLGANNGDRIPAVPINMRGGTFAFANNATAASFAETAGAVNVLAGTNYIVADQAAATGGRTSILTLGSLVRSQGSIIVFQSRFQGETVPNQIGLNDNRDSIVIGGTLTLNDGMIGGWAIYDNEDFATYNTTTVVSVKKLTYNLNLAEPSWTAASNVRIDQSIPISVSDAGGATRTVNSLNLANDNISIALNGLTLNIETGGFISQGSSIFSTTITNGLLTAGTAAGADLHIRVTNPGGGVVMDDVTIVNNGATQANATGLVKSGPGTLILTNVINTYTGPTAVIGGTLQIGADNMLGSTTGMAVGTLPLKLYDGTLHVTGTTTLNAARAIEVGGNSVISIAAGTTGQGKVLTFSGPLSSFAGTEGSLTFRSNAGEQSSDVDPGKIVFTVTTPMNLGGSLRIDATSGTVGFRPNANAANTIGRSLQVGMNGSAIFTQNTGTLSVGSGVDETLDIGVKDDATFSSVAKSGTLTLQVGAGAVSQFTAKVDKVRIGVQTQPTESVSNSTVGTLTLATNNDISAGTEIIMSDNANPNGTALTTAALTSRMDFGSGTNNVTTQSFTIGGRKGSANVGIATNGTLNLRGFGERTLNLSIGRNDSSQANITSTGRLDSTITSAATAPAATANTTVTGSFDSIVIGQKTGSTGAGTATGSFTLGPSAGNSVVANNVMLGVHTTYNGAVNNAAATSTGALTSGGGTFTVYNDVALGTQANNGTAVGTLNVTGGTFNVGGNITKTNADRSSGVINVNGATAVLNMRNPLVGDITSGTINASQLNFRAGSITNTAAINLDGRQVSAGVVGNFSSALVVRDVSLAAPVNLTGTSATNGGVLYEAAGGGAGGTLASVSLGTIARTFNVEDSAAASADLTVTGAVSGAFALSKTGAGTLVLNGPVAATSVTVVAGGLAGTGTIAGAVNINSTSTLSPGVTGASDLGTLGTGTLTMSAGTTLKLDINSTAKTTDKININGSLALDAVGPVTLSITDLMPGPVAAGTVYLFLDYSTGWNGELFRVDNFAITDFDSSTNPNSTILFVNGRGFRMDYNYNGGDGVALIAVPEPGSLALVAGGLALLGGRRRRSAGRR